MQSINSSVKSLNLQKTAKVAGIAYLLIIIIPMLSLLFVNPIITVEGDNIATLKKIVANEIIFRIDNTITLLMFVAVIILALALYKILKPVNKQLALIALFWRFAEALIGIVAVLVNFILLSFISNEHNIERMGEDGQQKLNQSVQMHLKMSSIVFLSLCLFGPLSMSAQKAEKSNLQHSKLPIKIAFGNQDVGLGFQNIFSSFNPNFELGTEYIYNKNLNHQIGQTAEIGFTKNDVLGNKLALTSGFFYRYTHKSGLFIDYGIEIGIAQQFHQRQVYEYDALINQYVEGKNVGKTTFVGGYGLSLGYDLSRKTKLPLSIYINYNFSIQYPYLDLDMFPFMPQSTTQIGITYKFRNNEK